ncbi:MAG: arylmalonate decarboxylase [Rhizobiales bacterium]|nr:arylmalonate decarboxylase [Hyphomicrobiales bacterium]
MNARVGLIIPSSNRMVEQEMVRAFPDGVFPHVTRLRMTGPNRMGHDQLIPRIEEASRTLADAKCDVVAFHCTANSMEEGQDGEARIIDAVKGSGARHATTTATAIRRALDALGARKIVLVTPYSQAVTDHEADFLNETGYDVIYAKGYELPGSDAYCATPPEVWRDRAIAAAHPDADVYFLSCANISVFSIIDDLEARLSRPVITSNQTVIWDALAQLGWRDRRRCPGRLFATAAIADAAPAAQRARQHRPKT